MSNEAKSIEIEINRNLDDFLEFSHTASKIADPASTFNIIISAAIAIIILPYVYDTLGDLFELSPLETPYFAPIIILYFVLLFFIMLAITAKNKKRWLHPKGYFLTPSTMTISPDGVKQISGDTYSESKWGAIIEFRETKGLLLFFIDNLYAYIIPKHCFSSKEAADKFFKTAQQFWAEANTENNNNNK